MVGFGFFDCLTGLGFTGLVVWFGCVVLARWFTFGCGCCYVLCFVDVG